MQAEIASSGTADLFIKATHGTKTRHAHEVTAACLYALIWRAYSTSVGTNQNEADEEVALSFQEWCSMQANKCVHFRLLDEDLVIRASSIGVYLINL